MTLDYSDHRLRQNTVAVRPALLAWGPPWRSTFISIMPSYRRHLGLRAVYIAAALARGDNGLIVTR
jgi:hypothetical protein